MLKNPHIPIGTINVQSPTRRGNNQYSAGVKPFEELGVTDAQLRYIAEHYGERPLVLLAQECELPSEHAKRVLGRLKKSGDITSGPGHNWRDTMRAHGYKPPPTARITAGGVRKAIVLTEVVEVKGDPLCTHHRICELAGDGREIQRCKLCGDVKVVRVW